MTFWVAGAVVGGGLISSIVGGNAAGDAADAQVQAADKSAEVQREIFDKQTELQAPFREAGLTAQNRLLSLLGLTDDNSGNFGKYAKDFSMSDFQADPGYSFRLNEGLKGLDRQAAARGGLISGAALKAATRYGQDYGSQEYQNAFNRYQVNRTNQIAPLQAFAGQAQSSANTLTGAAGNLANGLSDAYTGAGNARASGYVGSANALTNGITGGINNFLDYRMLSKLGAV